MQDELHVRGAPTIKVARLYTTQSPCPGISRQPVRPCSLLHPFMQSPERTLCRSKWPVVTLSRTPDVFHNPWVDTRVCQTCQPPEAVVAASPARPITVHMYLADVSSSKPLPPLLNQSFTSPTSICMQPRAAWEVMRRCCGDWEEGGDMGARVDFFSSYCEAYGAHADVC
jgi:hypothetical protein